MKNILDVAELNEETEYPEYPEYVEDEYCDWCRALLSQCNCDGGVGDNWIDLYLFMRT